MKIHARGPLCGAFRLLVTGAICSFALFSARAINLVQEFYLPMPEQQIYTALNTIVPGSSSTQSSTYSVVVSGDGTVIVYDQWEDGYETDISHPVQASTKVWGDGNDANGIAPGFAHDPVGLKAGTVITLTNNVPLPRNPSTLLYDGRDRIGASKALVVTHAGWPATQGPVYAGSVSVLATIDYGTNYISPVGENLTNKLFKYVGMFVMASENGTSVTIDPDGAGPNIATTIVLNQGESYLLNGGVKTGASVLATKPVQADLLIGDIGAQYAADWFTLTPVEQWSDSYYTPVGSAVNGTQPTYVYLYNPQSTNIVINANSTSGSTPLTVLPGAAYQFQMPAKSGASFVSSGGARFYALTTVAANSANDTAYNWGFSLLPKEGLTTEADVGWAPGSSDGSVNGSPVWVTALGATRLYVDYKGDHLGALTDPQGNKYDANFTLAPLQSIKIYDPSKNQTAMRVYTADGTLISVAWGEDPDVAAAGNPYIDAGTVVLPFPTPLLKKTSDLFIDTGAPGISVGDTLQYTVEVANKGLLPLGNVVVLDLPPTNLVTYVPNTTTLNGVAIPDDTSGTIYPLDTPGYTVPVILRSGISIFKYQVKIIDDGQITNVVFIGGTSIQAQNAVSTSANTSTVNFTDAGGTTVSSYVAGTNIYVKLIDAGGNVTPNGLDALTVVITNVTHGDFETLTLTETATNSGIFFAATGIPSSTTVGSGALDGTLNVAPGDTLQVSFTDPIYRNSASATASVQTRTVTKILYLTDPGQSMDRIDPVATGDSTTASSVNIGQGGLASGVITLVSSNVASATATTVSIPNLAIPTLSSGLLLVGITTPNSTASSITWGTHPLTKIRQIAGPSGKGDAEVWALVNPPKETNNLVATVAASGFNTLGALVFSGVNQTTTFSQTNTDNAGSGIPSVTIPSATGEVVFNVVAERATTTLSPTGTGQVQVWNIASDDPASGASLTPGRASVTTSWTTSTAQYGSVAVSIKPAPATLTTGPGTNATLFTQTPPFVLPFSMPIGGAVSITNYITFTNGSFLASGSTNVTATLLTNGVPFLTLNNPTYSAANSTLVWNGAMAGTVNIPAGTAITYLISNAVANTAFHLDYDSVSKPSRISLPTTTAIHVNTVAVYDAPYPAGNLVIAPTAGSTVYIRANVSDPFGIYDISNLNFSTTPPAGGTAINANVTTPVATTATTATYEYAWKTTAPLGSYNVIATATEGTEGITDVAATTVTVIVNDLGTPSISEFTTGNNGSVTNNYNANISVCLRVTDPDKNADSATAETITATVTSSSGDSELVTLTETTANSGIFTTCLTTSTTLGAGTDNGTLLAPVGSQVTLTYTDPADLTDQSSATATILPPPGVNGIAVNKTLISPATGKALVGDTIQFRLQVVNTGSTTLPNVNLVDGFPSASMTFQSASLAPSVVTANTLTWTNLGTLTPGQSTNINVFFTATAAATATNTAGTSSGATTNSGLASVVITQPALTITKTLLSPTNMPVSIGSNVVFQIVAKNTGSTSIPTLPMEDNFSGAYLQFVSATIPPDGSGAGSLIWTNLASPTPLAVGASITNTVTMKVVGAGNPALNTALVDFAVDGNGKPVPASSSTVTNLITSAASISGTVYNDINHSGTFIPGDTGLVGVTISLYSDPNGDGDPADGTLVQITTTDGFGQYQFLNLPIAHYVVIETDLPGYISSAPVNNRRAVNVTALTLFAGNDFYDYQAGAGFLGSIAGFVYNDTNGNGTNDVGEAPLSTVNIDLVQDLNTNGIADAGESVVASTASDANGSYIFVAIVPGNYVVVQTPPFSYYSDADAVAPADNQIPINLTTGLNTTNNNFYDRLSPTAIDDTTSGPRNTGIVISPLGNDISPNGDTLTVCGVSSTDGSIVIDPGATSLTFTPTNLGTATAIYTLCDGHGGTSSATITVTVTNSAPTAVNDSYSVNQDTTLNVPAPGVISNDIDLNSDTLTASLVTGTTHGSLSLNANGSFTYTPVAGYVGPDSFTYTVSDGLATSSSATVSITVNHVNHAPVSTDDSYNVNEDTTLNVVAPGVLTNDGDIDGDSITAVVVDPPTHGSLTLNANGSFSYTPATNYNGLDSFTYKATDGSLSGNTATVTLTIGADDDAPNAVDDTYTVNEDDVLNVVAPGVLTNDTDIDSTNLTAAVVSGPSHGTLTLNADGSFVYTPASNYNGPDSFVYKAIDEQTNSATATVNITVTAVNDAPVGNDDSYGVDEDTTLNVPAPGVLGNDTDIDGNPLTAVIVANPANGSVTLNADGSFSYTPATNFHGTDSFTYKPNDGNVDGNTTTVTITVNTINDAPVATDDSYTTPEDTQLVVPATGVLANDSDVDGDALTAAVVAGPSHGFLTLNTDGSFTYTPTANYNGPDSFTYKANDGTTDGNTATVSITVNAVNDAPVAVNDSYSVNEDTTLNISAPGVLGNDSDIDGDALTAVVAAGPAHGSLTLNANGSFTYTPAADYNGPDSFTYKANDGTTDGNTATVSITVNAVNDAPVSADDTYSTTEDTVLNVAAPGVLSNDSDVDGDAITAVLVAGTTNGTLTLNANGSFSYTPTNNYNGPDSFTYKANDGTVDGNVATVTINVTPLNDPPVAVDDSYLVLEDGVLNVSAPGVLGNDTDVDSTNLTATLVTGPSHGSLTLNADGSFIYTPTLLYAGPDSFVYQANDDQTNSSTATVNINVRGINHAPVAISDSYSVNEDTTLNVSAPGVLGNDTDLDNDSLTAVLVTGPTHGSLSLDTDGSFSYTPNANYNGADSFTYYATDGVSNSLPATVSLTINAVNDAPVAQDDSYSTAEDTALIVAAPGVLGNDSDIENNSLTAIVVNNPAHGMVTLNPDGSFTYTPTNNYNGPDSFTYKPNDGTTDGNVATVSINVTPVNDAPFALDDSYNATEDTTLTIAAPGVLTNDGDIDGNAITAILVSSTTNGTLNLAADGSFTYTPTNNYNGPDSFTYKVNDGTVDGNTATVIISVGAVNDVPVAVNDSYSVNEDTTLTIAAPGVLTNDTDVDSTNLTSTVVTGPSHGALTLNTDGSFSYTPDTNYNGSDSFTYQASDAQTNSSTATVTITVNPVNDAPVALDDSYSVNEDTTLTVPGPGVLANDTDIETNALTAIVVTNPTHGTLSLSADGSFSYTPAANYNGSDSFTYKPNDGTDDGNTATVSITINPVNDAPVATADSYSTAEDTTLNVPVLTGVLANDTDVDGNPLTAVLVTSTSHGSLSLSADGSFSYTPTANYNGPDSFTYKDNDGTTDGNTVTVSINVTPVNDAPVAVNDTYNTTEDTTLTVAVPGVLGNDTDIDGNAITAILVSSTTNGTLNLAADGSFTYTPTNNYNGPDSFTYKVNDGTVDGNTATVSITVNAANDAPVAVNDSYSVNEETTLTIPAPGVLANDTDVDSTNLTSTVVTGPSHGALTLNTDGSFTYTPDTNYNGSDSFTYQAADAQTNSSTATVTITVNPVNDAPVAVNDSYSVNEDTTLTVPAAGVLANDTDIETNALTAIVVSNPTHGTLSLSADGSFSYTPDANYNGTDSFTYKPNDGTDDGNTATVSITINPVNDAPVAVNDSYTVAEDTTLTVPALGVLVNDTDIDGNPLTAVLVTSTSHGSLSLSADGSFSYVPTANYNGPDSFTYKANDGTTDGNVATVSINVTPVNDAPFALDDSYNANEDTTLTVAAPGVLTNDGDIDGNALTAILVSTTTNGTLSLAADGSFTYTPTNNYNGPDSFTYKVNDGTVDGNTATVTITVGAINDPPVAVDDSYNVLEDGVLNISAPGVLSNDTDVDSTNLTASVVAGPSHGTLTLNADGSFTYTPTPLYNGLDTFTYQANDSSLNSSTATVTINVKPINHDPLAVNDAYSVNEDTTLTVSTNGVLANDTDSDNDTLTASVVSGPSHGTLTLNTDGTFTYTPANNYNGSDSFTYVANDGITNSANATVTITINAVNDAPVAAGDSYSVNEDSTLTVTTPGVLTNDIDIDGDALNSTVVTGPAHGALTLNANGSFVYTPAANYNGLDSFTYVVNDGTVNGNTATVNITVNPVNDAPVAANDTYSTAEDTTLNVPALTGVLANDSDIDGDTLTAVIVANPSHGTVSLNTDGSFTYIPAANYNGPDSFTYQAKDSALNSATAMVNITVTPVNDAPVATDDSYSTAEDTTLNVPVLTGVLANDSDIDGDTLTAVIVANPSHGTVSLNADGSFTYTPAANYNGPDSFAYQAKDSALNSATATVNITVTPVNDAPVAANDTYSTAEDTTLNVPALTGVLANDSDVDGDTLTAVIVTNATHGTVSLNADGSFTYIPTANYNGSDSFTYQAKDSALNSATATVNITVTQVNDAPVAIDDSYTTAEDTTLNVPALTGVLANDSDVDGDALTAVIVANANHGTVALNTDGSFTYTPAVNYNGADTFTYQAKDSGLNSATATVNINVTAVNDAPVASDDSYSTAEDTTLNVPVLTGVLANDSDIDGDTLTAVIVANPSHGSVALNADGSFTYTPAANYTGSDSFTYAANDGKVNGNIATVNITVTSVNDAPVAQDDNYSVNEDTALIVVAPGVLGNDSDIDSATLTATLVTGPTNGFVTLNTDGSFTYVPNTNYNGPDTFTYKATDGQTNSSTATVNITVTPVNDAPVAQDDSYSVNEDTTLVVSAPGVLGNDSDVDGTLTATIVANALHGNVTLNSDGSFTYVPAADYNGPDFFTYQATDGSLNSATATVNITVNPINDPPVALNDNYIIAEDTTLVQNVLVNDSDIDGNTLTAVLVSGPAHGALTLNSDGSFSYTPSANYNGPDSFTYKANDGIANGNVATVSITVTPVNDTPVAQNDSYSVNEDTTLSISAPGVLTNDSDVDGTLTATMIGNALHGNVTLNSDGSFTYVPAANYNGPDSFTYQATDGSLNSATATVNITVNPINDPPVAVNDTYTIAEDSTLNSNVLTNDTDVDGDSLQATLVFGPTHGSLTFTAATGAFTYTPFADYTGTDSFTYKATDGQAFSATATVSITVTAVNDAPIAANDTYTVVSGTLLTVAAPGVLANDSDVDNNPLHVSSIVLGPAHGVLNINSDGSFTYQPNSNYVGNETFTYTANDGTVDSAPATVTITVTPSPIPVLLVTGGTITLNPQTGLFEERVVITNSGFVSVPAFRVNVAGLRTNITLYNATGTAAGVPYVHYNAPLDPGNTVSFILKFFVADRKAFTNILTATPDVLTTTGTNAATGVLITRGFVDNRIQGQPRFVIEFPSIVGRTYVINYSDNPAGGWKVATPSIVAGSTKTQWYDDGAPETESAPLSNQMRVYRATLVPQNP